MAQIRSVNKVFTLSVLAVLSLTACSTKNDVVMNYDYQVAVAETEKARMEAIKEIARQGDTGAVAAAMMMQNQGSKSHAAPRSGGDSALAWAQVLVPATVQSAGIAVNGLVARTQSNNNKDVSIVSSNNSTTVAVDTNATMAGIAEVTIVNPEVVTSTDTITNTNSVTCVTDATYSCD
ncbi:hypothetical protein N8Z18_00045 [bacterium]|nr:hypothetical protein [bacterium]